MHRSTIKWSPFFKKTRKFEFFFPGTSRYIFNTSDVFAINKLIGFSDGTLNHHKNSFRIGWNYEVAHDNIAVYAYTYVDGERVSKRLGRVPIDFENTLEVSCLKGEYLVNFNNTLHRMKRSEKIRCNYKHMLWPYFGGQRTAPHTMGFYLRWK